jgi:hypothetical protein
VIGGEYLPGDESSWVSEAIILVGSVSSQVPEEEKSVNQYLFLVPHAGIQERTHSPGGKDHGAGRKRLRLALNVGRVVVGPEYSAEPVAHEVKEPSGRVVKRVAKSGHDQECNWAGGHNVKGRTRHGSWGARPKCDVGGGGRARRTTWSKQGEGKVGI